MGTTIIVYPGSLWALCHGTLPLATLGTVEMANMPKSQLCRVLAA
jgi:hypothetical protein